MSATPSPMGAERFYQWVPVSQKRAEALIAEGRTPQTNPTAFQPDRVLMPVERNEEIKKYIAEHPNTKWFTRVGDPDPVFVGEIPNTEGRPDDRGLGLPWEETITSLLDTSGAVERPVFPVEVLEGTSIYEGLVKPALETTSKHAQFIFFPAAQLALNYMSNKVQIPYGQTEGRYNLFVLLISPYGKFFKSSAAELAQLYFNYAGFCMGLTPDVTNANGKIIISGAGSAEGFCLAAQKINAKNMVIYNDELSEYVSKACIQSSSLNSMMLKIYESSQLSNPIKDIKKSFNILRGTYTFGWLSCTTDRMFPGLWAKIADSGSGITDRTLFICAPEKPKDAKRFHNPLITEGSKLTKIRIDAAVMQAKFEYDSDSDIDRAMAILNDPRKQGVLEKFALYFAVDLGLKSITRDCVRRACKILDFVIQSAAFIKPIEAENKQGALQQGILRMLRMNNGAMSYRDLCHEMDYTRHGTWEWGNCYGGLVKNGHIIEFQRRSTRRPIRMVGLLKQED
jgi:hypothetical protein